MATGDLKIVPDNHQHPFPPDLRFRRVTLNERDVINSAIRWDGMPVYVVDEQKWYFLKGGLTNEFWTEIGGAGDSITNAVQYIAQALTQEQQAQARANIGAAAILDGIISLGAVTSSANDVTIASAVWRINGVNYGQGDPTVIPIPVPAAGTTRRDIIVGNTSAGIVLVQGNAVASGEVAVTPDVPENTILLVETLSSDAGLTKFIEAALESYVRFDIGTQGLSPSQRKNARDNIQTISKDTDDTRVGTLTQTGLLTLLTGEDGTASSYIFLTQNTKGGGVRVQKRGSMTVRANGDSTTDYHIIRGEDVAGDMVFEVRAGGVTSGGDAVNNDDFATLGQVNAIAGGVDMSTKVDKSSIVDDLLSTDPTTVLSGNQGRVLKSFIDAINGILASDDTTLDELQEIVTFIKQNKTELENLGISNIAGLQAALDEKISGSGPQNYIPKFDATGKILQSSQIFDNGNSIGINNPSPAYKLDVNSETDNFLQILRNGLAATEGYFRITNYTTLPGVIAPIHWGKSNDVTYPGSAFIGDVKTDTGTVPIIRIQGRQNNVNVVNRPILGVENGPTDIKLFSVHADGRVQIHSIDNATGDILHVSASGVVTKRTLAELKADLDITFDTSDVVTISGNQTITGPKHFNISLSTDGALLIKSDIGFNYKAGYASINYHSTGRFYLGTPDGLSAILDMSEMTDSAVYYFPPQGGRLATEASIYLIDKGGYYSVSKPIQQTADPGSRLIQDQEIPYSNIYQMGLDASERAIIRTHNLPASGVPNWKTSGIYGTPDSPLSGSLATVDLVQARNTTITIYHRDTTEPAWPPYTYQKGEAYSLTDLNIIHFRHHSSTLLVSYIETIPYTAADITSGRLFDFFHTDTDLVWDGITATGVMEDHSGLADATVVNPDTLSWVDGQVDRACFLGTEEDLTPYSYLKIPTTSERAAITTVFTWSSWITYPTTGKPASDFLVTDIAGGGGIYIQSSNSNTRIECILDRNLVTPSSTTRLRLDGVFTVGVPVHITFRYDGFRIYGYVNGAWAGTTGADYTSPGLGNANEMLINSNSDETGGWGSFIMERNKLFNRGLTDTDIHALANE